MGKSKTKSRSGVCGWKTSNSQRDARRADHRKAKTAAAINRWTDWALKDRCKKPTIFINTICCSELDIEILCVSTHMHTHRIHTWCPVLTQSSFCVYKASVGGAQEYVHRMLALQLVGYLGRARQSLPHDDDFMCVLYVFWKLV
jgi:hypothetical protein